MYSKLLKIGYALSIISLILLLTGNILFAETYKFMDSSGNLHFVERADQVPAQYRNQVPALVTPVVKLDPKQARK